MAAALGGLAPLHVGSSDPHSRKETQDDWHWSVGTSPLALTETDPEATEFSIFNVDALHRSTIAQSMLAGKMMLGPSYGISDTIAALHSVEYLHMVLLREEAVHAMDNITWNVKALRFDEALRALKTMLEMSRKVVAVAQQMHATEAAHACVGQGRGVFGGDWTRRWEELSGREGTTTVVGASSLLLVVVVVVLGCWVRWRRGSGRLKSSKAKIN